MERAVGRGGSWGAFLGVPPPRCWCALALACAPACCMGCTVCLPPPALRLSTLPGLHGCVPRAWVVPGGGGILPALGPTLAYLCFVKIRLAVCCAGGMYFLPPQMTSETVISLSSRLCDAIVALLPSRYGDVAAVRKAFPSLRDAHTLDMWARLASKGDEDSRAAMELLVGDPPRGSRNVDRLG